MTGFVGGCLLKDVFFCVPNVRLALNFSIMQKNCFRFLSKPDDSYIHLGVNTWNIHPNEHASW